MLVSILIDTDVVVEKEVVECVAVTVEIEVEVAVAVVVVRTRRDGVSQSGCADLTPK